MTRGVALVVALLTSGVYAGAFDNPADLNNDGRVDLEDLAILAENWMWSSPISEDVVPVPAGLFKYQDGNLIYLPDYAMDRFEVTVGQYCAFLNDADPIAQHWDSRQEITRTGSPGDYVYEVQAGREEYPVRYVSYHDAVAFAAWKSAITGSTYRLPTEQEWEKAAGWDPILQKLWKYGFKRDSIDCSWCNYTNCVGQPRPVGYYSGANAGTNDAASYYGCYDMSGNVWEWTASLSGTQDRVVRGGYWGSISSFCRVTYRDAETATKRAFDIGFRLVQETP